MQSIFRLLCLFLFTLSMYGCNVTEQTKIEGDQTGLTTESFQYSSDDLDLVVNTTTANIIPLQLFDSPFYEVSPSLPTGLVLDPNTGEISGTPASVSTDAQYLIKVTHRTGYEYAYINIEVIEEPPKAIYYSASSLNFTLDAAGVASVTSVSGGSPTSYSISPSLPAGLSFNASNGQISGTPTAVSSGYYTISASNSSGSATTSLLVTVHDKTPVGLSYTNDAQTVNIGVGLTTMTPSFTDIPDSAVFTISPSLPSGLSLNTTTGEITGTPTGTNGITSYTVTAYNAAGSATATITLTVNNPATAIDYGITEVQIQQGVRISPLTVDSYSGGLPVTYSTADADFTTLGLTLNSTTGAITGTSSAAIGTYTVTIEARDTATNTLVTTDIDFKVVEDYPENNTLGYNSSYIFYKEVPISDYCENDTTSTPDFTITIEATCTATANRTWIDADASATTVISRTTTGQATLYSISPAITAIAGLGFDTATGQITGTPSAVTSTTTFTITGSNLDETAAYNISTIQTITIEVKDLAPTELGYLNTSSAFYDAGTQIFALQDGNNAAIDIRPNISTGKGVPDSYSITPQLPDGLSLDPNTGEITGTPSEIVPVKYYSITGTNSAGSYTESIAISTNTLIAPQSLEYNGDLTLSFNIFTFNSFDPTYVGSQGSFTISPDLPTGLILNPSTGVISGAPVIAQADGTSDEKPITYTVTATNSLGSVQDTTVNIAITNTAPANLIYTDASDLELNTTTNTLSLTEGDSVTNSIVKHSSDYENASPRTGYITNYTTAAAIGTFGLTLDAITGDITGTATAVDPTSLSAADYQLNISISGTTDTDPANGSTTLNTTTATNFLLEVLQELPEISYESGTNLLRVKGDDGATNNFTPTNDGGPIALTPGPAAYCNYTLDSGTIDLATSPMAFDQATCTVTYDGTGVNKCFSVIGEETASYTIAAQNTGGTSSTSLTVYYYDGPNFTYNPDSSFPTETLSVLNAFQSNDDNTGSATSLEAPVQDTCHVGTYTLSDVNDLPTPFAFSSTTGHVSVVGNNILGRRSFNLTASRSGAPVAIADVSEDIEIQSNHIEANSGASDFRYITHNFDFDLDGKEDIFIRNQSCEDGACTGNNVASVYLQSGSDEGLFEGTLSALPVTTNLSAIAATPIKYDTSKTGLLYVNLTDALVYAQSTSSAAENSTIAIDGGAGGAGDARGIVPMQTGNVTSFGVILQDTATTVSIEQYDIAGASLGAGSMSDNATNANLPIQNLAAGGITGSIDLVTYNDTNGDSFMDAIIAFTNGTDTYICVLQSTGAQFSDTCSPRLDIANDGTVKEIKFEDIEGDSLDEMIVLAGDSVYVYENKNNSFTGLYQATTILPLKSTSADLTFDLADINGDGYYDLLANDIEAGGLLQGLTIYYNSNISGELYTTINSQAFSGVFNYSTSQGSTNELEIIQGINGKHIFHCQVDTTTRNESSCGIIGAF